MAGKKSKKRVRKIMPAHIKLHFRRRKVKGRHLSSNAMYKFLEMRSYQETVQRQKKIYKNAQKKIIGWGMNQYEFTYTCDRKISKKPWYLNIPHILCNIYIIKNR